MSATSPNPWWILLMGVGWVILALVGLFIAAIIIGALWIGVKNAVAEIKRRREIRKLRKRYYVKQKDRPKTMEEFEESNWGIDESGEDNMGTWIAGWKRPK